MSPVAEAAPSATAGPAGAAAETVHYMQIGEVSERTGLTQRTLRYYESIGLLEPETRMDGGFRLYTEEDVRRLDQIVQLKKLLGFTLAEIRQIVDADETLRHIRRVNKGEPDLRERRTRLQRAATILAEQLALVETRIAAMRDLEASYRRRLEHVRGRLQGLDEQLADGPGGRVALVDGAPTVEHAAPEPAGVR